MASGDDTALAIGIRPERVRLYVMIIVSLSVGVMVAGSGIIGFVGLVSPHIGRMLIGSRHRILIPASAGIGAVFLVIADIGARTLFPPQELAIGVVTGRHWRTIHDFSSQPNASTFFVASWQFIIPKYGGYK